jgi:hypothetical protein
MEGDWGWQGIDDLVVEDKLDAVRQGPVALLVDACERDADVVQLDAAVIMIADCGAQGGFLGVD